MLRITKLSGEDLASLPVAELSDVKALKQRLHKQHALPPRFRQRLLHSGNALDDAVKLDSVMDLQSAAGSDNEQRHLAAATENGSVDEDAPKRRLNLEDGLPPPHCKRCMQQQRSATPDSVMDLQVLILGLSEASSEQQRELWEAASEGLEAEVEALLQLPIDPDVVIAELNSTTPLMRASANGHAHVAELLLEAGARKELRDRVGSTALMFAALRCHEPVVQLLLEADAQRDARDEEHSTALMYAAFNGRVPAVRLLLEAGAQKDLRDKDGRTALMDAAKGGHVPVVELLLEARADQDVRDNDGMTAQMLAVDDGHRQVAQLLGFTYKRKSSSSPTVAPPA